MPRRNPGRSTEVKDRVSARMLAWLDENDRTIAWLERKMHDVGQSVPVNSMRKCLLGDRDLSLNEATAMAMVMGITVQDLLTAEERP